MLKIEKYNTYIIAYDKSQSMKRKKHTDTDLQWDWNYSFGREGVGWVGREGMMMKEMIEYEERKKKKKKEIEEKREKKEEDEMVKVEYVTWLQNKKRKHKATRFFSFSF